jgi:D-threo-aldose 1-dehydrogenase
VKRVALGRTGLQVTQLGLGTAPIGGLFQAVSDEQAVATVERAWELGLRFFDTAPLYGHGLSESRLGRALAGKPRDEYVLATKVGRLLRPGSGHDPSQGDIWHGVPDLTPVRDYTRDGALRSLEESLERLGLDRVDIVHIHDPDDHHDEALAAAYPALDELRSSSAIRAVGAGMNQSAMLARFAGEADFDCFLLAGRYSLLDQSGARDLLPACLERGIAVIVGGVFNSGLLAGGATYDYSPAPAQMFDRARRLGEICAAYAVPLKAAALQFPFRHPAVTSVVVGARSPREIEECVALFELELPHELWGDLDQAHSGPSG